MYEGAERDAANAEAKWTVIRQFQDGKAGRTPNMAAEFVGEWDTRYVEAEAGTGSRYVVVVTRLGMAQMVEGGPLLITVLWPWQDAWTMAEEGYLDQSYVLEHLTVGRGRDGRLHGGDLQALTMTIRHALSRSDS